jgi:uncharacterized RDD family membrane protein YckC
MARELTLDAPVDTICEIETPEHISFSHRLAGPSQRVAAYLIDFLIRGVIVGVILMVLVVASQGAMAFIGDETASGMFAGAVLIVAFILEWGYFVFCEMLMNGQSPGKKMLGLRVVRQDGAPLGFGDSALRNLMRAMDGFPPLPFASGIASYAVGLTVLSRDEHFRRLGDMVAGTIVVREARANVDGPLHLGETEPLPVGGRLPLTRDEIETIEVFLRRLPRLHPARAEELAGLLAPALAARLGLDEEDTQAHKNPTRFLVQLYQHRH